VQAFHTLAGQLNVKSGGLPVRGTRGAGESLARGIRHHAIESAANPKTAQGIGRAGLKAAVLDYQRTGIVLKEYRAAIRRRVDAIANAIPKINIAARHLDVALRTLRQ
jgi:hypothetical protein